MGINCVYTFGKDKFSYAELYSKISKQEYFNGSSDILFSKSSRFKDQTTKLQKIKVDGIESTESTKLSDGEPNLKGGLSVLDFIDSEQCNIGGTPLVPRLNNDDYLTYYVKQLVDSGISEEEAQAKAKQELENWEHIREDGLFIHKLANSSLLFEDDVMKVEAAMKDSIPQSFFMQVGNLKEGLHKAYISEKGRYADSKAYRGLVIKSKLKGLDKDLLGKIDWLFVGADGTLHLYLIKTSTQKSKDWIDVKRKKYIYQLAFLKQMLANNGIDVENIDLNVVPVYLEYNGGKISKVQVESIQSYSTRKRSAEYAMQKYDNDAAHFIDVSMKHFYVSQEPVKRAVEVTRAIFPTINIRESGTRQSAVEWAKYAPTIKLTGDEPLVITKVNEKDHAYEVFINGKKHNIVSNKAKEKNKEIIDLIQEYIDTLEDNKGYSVQKLKDTIAESYSKGFMTFSQTPGLKNSSIQLEAIFSKYVTPIVTKDGDKETKEYEWEFLPDLIDASVLLFRNKATGILDVISISPFDLRAAMPNKGNRKNLLGWYKEDTEYIDLDGDYGNVEAVRAMTLLNEMLPHLGDNIKLGTLGVLSTINGSPFRQFNIGEFNKQYFSNIISVVNQENSGLDVKNNFPLAKFSSPLDELLTLYTSITKGKSHLKNYDFSDLDLLLEGDTNQVVQEQALRNFLAYVTREYPRMADPSKVEALLNQSGNSVLKNIATLYEMASRAYLSIRGETAKNKNYYNRVLSSLMTATTVDDENIRTIVNNLQITHDAIASEFIQQYDAHIRTVFQKFYESAGYSQTQNLIVGNQASQFKNLYERDENGNNLLIFKNPYDNTNDLKEHERTLLKEVLFRIAQINSNYNFSDGNYRFVSSNDSRLIEWTKKHPEYFWVPLERAAPATRRQSKEAFLSGIRNFFKKIKNASESYDEFVEQVTSYERDMLGTDNDNFYMMTLKNPFSRSIPNSSNIREVAKNRAEMIEEYGAGFFETNLENILIDFLGKQISTTQYNKLLIGSKALLLELFITGNYNGNKEIVEKEIKYIQDYLKINVFKTSIMSPAEKKIVGVISPIKRLTTHMLLGGNVVGALRDSLEGAQQNFIRSVIKLHTDIDPSDVARAYKYVHTHATVNAMAQNLLSKLCLKYRISNTDVGRITERMKTSRNGILNFENGMYFTLRGPDFVNRMTLFAAKCMHDGSWEAFSLNSDGDLVYDWTKDARFKAYKYGTVGSEEYKKAKSAYFSAIREYNQDHLDNPISYTDNLPEPYSFREINAIRGLGDNIYGSYDKGKKGMVEHESWGFILGSFTTWMNGIVNNYFMPTQKNGVSQLYTEQEIDEQGRKLFFDEYGNITTEDTGMPVLKHVPLIVQGILPSIGNILSIAKLDGFDAVKKYIQSNEVVKANMLKLGSDALLWLLLALLFKLAITPQYKEYKKEMAEHGVLENLLTEILYKSSSRSFDQYKGIINVMQFFGENMNPPFYSMPAQIMKETGQAIIGEKSWKYLLFDNTGLTRSFKDTGFAYLKQLGQ